MKMMILLCTILSFLSTLGDSTERLSNDRPDASRVDSKTGCPPGFTPCFSECCAPFEEYCDYQSHTCQLIGSDRFHHLNLLGSSNKDVKNAVIDEFKVIEGEPPKALKYASNAVVDEFHLTEKETSNAFRHAADAVVYELQAKSYGCHCENHNCGCCAHWDIPKLHINDTGCVNLTYLVKDYGISFTVTIDDFTIFNETISARNPPPICFGVPYLEKLAAICVLFYDLDVTRTKLHGCVDIEAVLEHIVIERVKLGCFNIPTSGTKSTVGLWKKYHRLPIEKNRSQQKKLTNNSIDASDTAFLDTETQCAGGRCPYSNASCCAETCCRQGTICLDALNICLGIKPHEKTDSNSVLYTEKARKLRQVKSCPPFMTPCFGDCCAPKGMRCDSERRTCVPNNERASGKMQHFFRMMKIHEKTNSNPVLYIEKAGKLRQVKSCPPFWIPCADDCCPPIGMHCDSQRRTCVPNDERASGRMRHFFRMIQNA